MHYLPPIAHGMEAPIRTILLVSAYHPELFRGGAQQACLELFEGLRAKPDIRPVLLAAADAGHAAHAALFKSGAWITGFDGKSDQFLFLSRGYDHWWHKSTEPLLAEALQDFLGFVQPEIVHFNHFMFFGMDLISLTKRVLPNARIVLTFMEFLAICAAKGHMARTTDKSPCTRESQVRCHQCVPAKLPEEFFLRKMWIQRNLQHVDVFTCPTRFMVQHYVNWGIPAEKIQVVPLAEKNYGPELLPNRLQPRDQCKRNHFGFFGQLVDNKGVHIVLQAVELLRAQGFTDFTVEINGANLEVASVEKRAQFEAFMKEEAGRPLSERIVSFNGSYDVENLRSRMDRLDWCLVPSVWWETYALVISEAWMFGKPVICSNIGAMAERVKDGVDGLHFEVGDAEDLARILKRAATEERLWERLAEAVPVLHTLEEVTDGYCNVYG